jgi:imidazolonepropionase-like amidohydrolase
MGNAKSLARGALAALGLRPPVVEVPSQGFVLHDVTVVNPGMDRKVRQSVTVKGSTIADISSFESLRPEIDGGSRYAGAYALPGLIDMHVHFPVLPTRWIPTTFDAAEGIALLFLAYGVTTVRDVGNFNAIWRMQKKMEQGYSPCPRLFCCGQIIDGEGSKLGGLAQVVRNPAEARAAVNDRADRGAGYIKVYDWLTPDSLAAARDAAAKRGLRIVGQLPFSVNFEDAGVEDVQHLNGVQFKDMPLGFNFHDPKDFAMYYRTWADIDEERIEEIVRISVEQNIVHTPTIVVQDRIARIHDPDVTQDQSSLFLPRYYRDVMWNPEVGISYLQGHSDAVLTDMKKAIVQIKRVVGRLNEAGVRILVGTDGPGNPGTTPGVSLHEELHNLVLSGLSPEEALAAGTRHGGEFLGSPMLGTLQENAPADIALFREDPTRDLAALSTLEAVAANGRLYPKAVLGEGLNRHKKYFEGRIFEFATMAMVRQGMKMFD